MGDMDRPIHFRRNHQTTDEWYASTLDAQVRARWKAPPKDIAKKAALGNRLAGLYGANTSSKMVRRRAGRLVHELEKASFNSPASLRRSMSPKKNKKRGKTSYKSPSGSSSVYLVDANDLSSPGERGAFTPGSDATNRPTTNTSSTYIEANIQTLPNTPSGNQLGGVMMESVDNYSTHTKRNSNSPTKRRGYNHVQSKVSPKPKYQRSKFKGPQFKGFYVGAGKAAPGSPFGSVPRYGFQGTINVLKKEHPMMMSPIGLKTRNTPKKKGMLTIPRSNVYTQPFTFKPTRDWPAEAFKMSNKKKKKGEITARDTRGVRFELNEVTKLYDFASEEKIYRKQESRMKLKSTGLDKFNPDGTPRRNALKHLGSVGKLNLSKSAAWGNDPETFPETLFDYMRQKKWEREVYHDDLKRAHTAKFNVTRTKRQSRQALLKEVREKQKAADQRARTVGPLVYRNRQGRVMKTDTPGVRLTEKLVQPVTRMKYWTSLTAIYAERDTSESSMSAQERQKAEREARLSMKWQELLKMHKLMRNRHNRTKGNDDIDAMMNMFEEELKLNTDPHICDRDTFVRLLQHKYPAASFKHLNRLFSAMDIDRTNQVDFRDFVAALRIFRRPTERTEDKLASIFKLYDIENSGALPKPEIKQILYTCAVTEEEKVNLDKSIDTTLAGQSVRDRSDLRPSFLGLAYVGVSGAASALGGMASFGSTSSNRTMHVKLDKFLNALKEDPDVLEVFETQLVQRLEDAKFEGRPFNYTKPPPPKEEIGVSDSTAKFNELMGVSEDNHLIHGTEEFKEELKNKQRQGKLEHMRATM